MPSVFDSSSAAIGAVQSAMLTEAQFQAQFGTGWVLARGQSVAGSKYASLTGNTTLPDLRGVFLRGKNNGRSDGNQNPNGESALGVFENDQVQGHIHGMGAENVGGGGNLVGDAWNSGSSGNYPVGTGTGPAQTDGTNGVPRIGFETRVKNVTVNYFIRIN